MSIHFFNFGAEMKAGHTEEIFSYILEEERMEAENRGMGHREMIFAPYVYERIRCIKRRKRKHRSDKLRK